MKSIAKKNKYAHSKQILSEIYDGEIYEQRCDNSSTMTTNYNLLEIDNWDTTTPKEL